MTENRNPTGTDQSNPCKSEIDRNAPAGSASSLGAKSDCNGRPATDDSVVEAIDEEGPVISPTTATNSGRS